jgi:hypothetical protein
MLHRATILSALGRLASLLHERGAEGEICLLGGTAMILVFDARPSTKDVDAIFQPTALVRELSQSVASELDLPPDWLNDAAKGFVSTRHEVSTGDLPQFPGLRIVAPTAEYLLAMKCMASRIAAGSGGPDDVGDIRFLLQHLHIATLAQALDIVAKYYPAEHVPPRAQFLLEELIESGNAEGSP